MDSLLLDRTLWDLCLDAKGNIAVTQAPYAIAQDVACACRLFLGELYYDTTDGIPYFQEILGHRPPMSLLKASLSAASLSVPGVASAIVFISSMTNRVVDGQIQVTTTDGGSVVISLGSLVPIH